MPRHKEDRNMKRSALYLLMATLLVTPVTFTPPAEAAESQIRIQIGAPYYYSPVYCNGCEYGYYGGRWGYHRGGAYRHEEGHELDHHEYHPGNSHEGHENSWREQERARQNWEREHRE
jgi:hypothetical protein